jgi:MoaA/NifB/PqqE/SkfB family radical SAM enzyme
MLLIANTEKFKRQFSDIIRCVDNYNNEDKEKFLNQILTEILKKIKNENCGNLIFAVLKNLNNLILINKKLQIKQILNYYLDLYIRMANKNMQLKVKELNIYNERTKKKILKIFKDNQDILTDGNKWQIIESVMSCYRNDFLKTIEMLCGFISAGKYFDGKLSERLGLVLREKNFSVNEKNGIIRILKKYYKKTKNVKYKNIFLNEIEILQNKVILKSKPRAIMVLLRTNEIMETDSELCNFIVSNMPYLEEVTWQTEDGSLNNKFKELTDLADKYNVRQNIITHLLFVDEDLINKINDYSINLQVTIDAVDKKTYEEIRVGSKYENLLEKLEALKKLRSKNKKFEYGMQSVIVSKNYERLDDMIKFAIFYNFDRISFLKYVSVQKDDLSLSEQQKTEVFNKIVSLKNKYDNIIIETNIELESDESKEIADDGKGKSDQTEDTAEQKIVCSKGTKQYKYDLFYTSPWTRICLDFKQYVRIISSSNQIDIKKYKYDEIWNCEELVDYRREIINNDFFRQFKTIDADKYETEDGKIKKLLKIFNDNQDMLTDSNKWQIIEFLLSFYKENIVKKIKMLCDFINNINSFNWKLSKELAILLREKNFSVDEKNSIIRILKKYYKKTKNVKYKNIFLNEIEILQNKVILKSKPRELDVTVTTRCNLRCIMCDIHDLPDYTIDNKIYLYIKKTLPYLENIVWKGGEVFLYDKFYEFINIASRYGVLQTIITNGLFLTDNWVELIVQYKIELVISIDSADKKIYEGIRKGADFNVLINNLKILEKYYSQNDSFRYKMAVVVMSVNYNQIEQLINFAILHKFGSIHFQACTNCKNKYLFLNDSNRKEVIEQIEKYKNQYRNRITIFTDATLDINYFNQIPGTAKSQICEYKKNTHKKKIQSLKKFCYRPFFKIALNSEQNNINFGCGCTSIDISKYQYDEIWNCSELVKYRKSIISNDLSICKL